jgi:hypothetical protein
MNTIEDRIRAAARAAADTVPPDSVPPLVLPAGRPSRFRRRRRAAQEPGPRWVGRLAPVAAALAVVAIVISAVIVGRTGSETPGSTGTKAAAPGRVTPGPPISTYVRSGQVPPYYVAITSHGNPNVNPSYAVVRATVSGKTLATVKPSATDGTIVAVTAAGDDRTFVLDEQPWVKPGSSTNQSFEPRTFYMFRLSSSGQPGPLTKLPMSVPRGEMMTGFALSPDGSRLATAVEPDNVKKEPNLQEIRLYTLGTGVVRTWSGDGTIGTGPDDARSISWTADQRTLAFDWAGNNGYPVRLLNVGARGSSLLADSRPQALSPLSPAQQSGGPSPYPPACQQDLIITPDGSSVVCGAIQGIYADISNGADQRRGAVTEFREYSTATGKIVRILGHWTFARVGELAVNVLWSNSSGSLLIGVIPTTGDGRVGVISGNTFTPIPAQTAGVASLSGTW